MSFSDTTTVSVEAGLLKIGEVAALSRLPVKTIRYYEDIGLLKPMVVRSSTRYRLFSPRILQRLAFIKRVQSLGLSLAEVAQILQVYDRGQLPCGEVKQHLLSRLAEIDRQIAELQILRGELRSILTQWQDQPSAAVAQVTICPNLASFDQA